MKGFRCFSAQVSAFFALFLLVSCGNRSAQSDADLVVIPRDQMVRLMADMELTEALLKNHQVKMSRDSVNLLSKKYYDSLYNKYGVTQAQFDSNLKYYQSDIEDFLAMTDSVIINLTRRKDSVSNLKASPPLKNDTSVKKAPVTVKN